MNLEKFKQLLGLLEEFKKEASSSLDSNLNESYTTIGNVKSIIKNLEKDLENKLPIPKYKVGQYLVKELPEASGYIKITQIIYTYADRIFFYNGEKEKDLRLPTSEELETYFR